MVDRELQFGQLLASASRFVDSVSGSITHELPGIGCDGDDYGESPDVCPSCGAIGWVIKHKEDCAWVEFESLVSRFRSLSRTQE
jgi:hypothetical protein